MFEACWSCKKNPKDPHFCVSCGALQPPQSQEDPFSYFGLSPSLDIDRSLLKRKKRGLQKALHPDLFSQRPPKEKVYAQGHLNQLQAQEATLMDPLKRLDALFRHHGLPIAKEGHTIQNMEILTENLEMREKLEGIQNIDALEAFQAEIHGSLEALEKSIESSIAAPPEEISVYYLQYRYRQKLLSAIKEKIWKGLHAPTNS